LGWLKLRALLDFASLPPLVHHGVDPLPFGAAGRALPIQSVKQPLHFANPP